MINFTVYGYRYKEVHWKLQLNHGSKKNVKLFLEECSEIIAASFLEKIPEEYGVDQTECSICGASLENQSHSSRTGCDDCVEGGLTHCECCDIEHDLFYLAEKHNIIIR